MGAGDEDEEKGVSVICRSFDSFFFCYRFLVNLRPISVLVFEFDFFSIKCVSMIHGCR